MKRGLSSFEAASRLQTYGPNLLATRRRLPGVGAFAARFKNPLVVILILAAGLSAFLGDIASSVIIVCIVVASIGLDFVNSYRSERAAQTLERRVRVLADVLRDGTWSQVPLANLVPGDIVRLKPGRVVPADGTLLESTGLYVNESALTGESFPQAKPVASSLYLGSSITSGSGLMTVTTTGRATKFAQIARSLHGPPPATEFDREIQHFSLLIAKITFGLVLFIFAVNAIFKHGILDSLLFSLALAVGLTPELLPLIITLNLSKGSLVMAKHGVIVKKLSSIQNFGSMDVLCTDKTGTLTEDKIVLVKYVDGQGKICPDVLLYGYLSASYSTGYVNPLDTAVKAFERLSTAGWHKIKEIPFDFERKRDSVVVSHQARRLIITKGAPEEILAVCQSWRNGQTLTKAAQVRINREYEQLSQAGFRVLAVAVRPIGRQKEYQASDETDLVFQGFIAFLDPAKKTVSQTLENMERYGVAIKIITGDNALVTKKIATDIHLPVQGVMTGTQLSQLNDLELARAVETATIFARVNPEQKLRIIQALQRNGRVVGYLGDGINDAPSLRAADIGISVNNAVDVAKESADLILLHKSLSDLTEGIVEGRRTFVNTRKYLMMSLSSNFGNMFSMAGASLILPFLPMIATQILLNNLLYDLSQFTLPLDNVDPTSIDRPHTLDLGALKRFMWVFGPLSSLFDFATFGLLALTFHLAGASFQTGWFVESILTQILVIYIIRTRLMPFVQSRPSRFLVFSSLGVLVLAAGVVFSPLGRYFHFVRLPNPVLLSLAGIVVVYLICAELAKQIFSSWINRGEAAHS